MGGNAHRRVQQAVGEKTLVIVISATERTNNFLTSPVFYQKKGRFSIIICIRIDKNIATDIYKKSLSGYSMAEVNGNEKIITA